ncbi:MAG: hypothetical protein HXX12_10345 [Geothrix sp.]|uniref:hypothetical protein n=1 Tax=Geothrix sp. TaxID=1962974 RepID=UPI0017A0403B|nr:hypothetical protein [Geothrix sp.]NWJ41358.1 hypothetical protein [Geothrix sp.]WIL20655.1 MAG: hypothetical protein QOZ81_003235 [Geothrix sp.]
MALIKTSHVMRAVALLVGVAPVITAQELPIPGRGTVSLVLPSEWKEVQRLTPKDLPPTLAFERAGTPRGSLQVTVLWSPRNEPDFTLPERLRGFCLAGQNAFKGQTVEQELPLKTLTGSQGAGFFYEATDKAYRAPAGPPPPGEFPILTHGELGLGRLMLSFTIMSDAKGDPAVAEALAAIQKAVFRPQVPAAATKIQGAGISLTADLEGFQQKMGEKHFHGAYYQVGYFTSEAWQLNLSVLVDDLNGKSLADLEKAGQGQSQGAVKLLPGGKVRSEPIDEPRGFLISYPSEFPMKGYFMAQWYFETIHQGKWLELHFSKVLETGKELEPTHAEVLRIVRSIRAR